MKRRRDDLIIRWDTPMEAKRHGADSLLKYEDHFTIMDDKIQEHDVRTEDTYNMDEKGFLMGVIGKQKRVFSREAFECGRVKQSSHDGSKEWASLLAAICADGSYLPPGLIYPAESNNIQNTWVADVSQDTLAFVARSPTGWSNNDAALGWLSQVFDRYTRAKADGRWRLLIVYGHGSHGTREFINLAIKLHIYIAILPPHSTQTLQPLDVACFGPLSRNYTKALTDHLMMGQGLLSFQKGDFFRIFWQAWVSTFTKKS